MHARAFDELLRFTTAFFGADHFGPQKTVCTFLREIKRMIVDTTLEDRAMEAWILLTYNLAQDWTVSQGRSCLTAVGTIDQHVFPSVSCNRRCRGLT